MADFGTSDPTDEEVEYSVGKVATNVFIGFGATLDIVNFILGITGVGEIADEAIDGFADAAIPMLAFFFNIPLTSYKMQDGRLGMVILTEGAKLVPVINLAPLYTYETWRLIKYSRDDDRERAKKDSAKKAQQQQARMVQQARIAAMREQLRNSQEAEA